MLPRSVITTGQREQTPDQGGGHAIRKSEMRVDDFEGEAAPQPHQERHQRQRVEEAIEELAVAAGRGEEPRMVHREPVLVVHRSGVRPIRSDPAIEREPWNRRDHDDVAPAGEARDALANEYPRLGCVEFGNVELSTRTRISSPHDRSADTGPRCDPKCAPAR